MSKKQISLLFAAVFLTACQQNVVQPNSTNSVAEAPESATELSTPLEQEQEQAASEETTSQASNAEGVVDITPVDPLTPAQQLTQSLIEKGRQAYLSDRLLTPADDNANLYFQAALGRDPGNFDAIQGIAQIVETYADWAWQKALQGQYVSAQKYLDSASSVNPQDPLIDEYSSRISDLRLKRKQQAEQRQQRQRRLAEQRQAQTSATDASEEPDANTGNLADEEATPGVFALPKDLFTLSDDEILVKIQPIIDAVTATQSGLDINWPNDKQARLIYQIINSRTDFRVRGMIYHRARYNVELQQD